MHSIFSKLRLAIAVVLIFGSTNFTNAQIVLNEATMASEAVAETDAGPMFNYVIDNFDELDSFGPYSFTEYGQAPGFNSEAEVGVEHASDLQAGGFELSGEAYAYCADDNGYAYLSADSQASQYITFTLPEQTRIQITGNLDFAGFSAVEEDAYFALRPYGGSNLYQVTNAGDLAFDQVLPAGVYQLSVLSRVWLEFDFAGGDLYEFSVGSFQVSLTATAMPVAAPSFVNVRHRVRATSVDEEDTDTDTVSSSSYDPFLAEVDVSTPAVTAIASMNSDLDSATGYFYAYGYAASGLYIQGSASSDSDSLFFTTFDLTNPGTLELEGEVGVVDFLGTMQSQDDPGFARVIVRLRDMINGGNVINKVITLNGSVPNNNVADLEELFPNVALQPGRYRLIIRAIARDDAVYEEVAGSMAVGYLEVEGRISEHQ